MKELQAKRFEVGVTIALPKHLSTKQRPIPSLPVKKSEALLQQRVIDGLRRLEAQAERINHLSAEIEMAAIELRAISTEVNRDLRAMQTKNRVFTATDICEYSSLFVPYVGQKPCGSLFVTTRSVDLFKQEREAVLVARQLRERTGKKTTVIRNGNDRGLFA